MSILSRESLVSISGQQLVWPNCDTKARYGKEGTGRQGTGIHALCDIVIGLLLLSISSNAYMA